MRTVNSIRRRAAPALAVALVLLAAASARGESDWMLALRLGEEQVEGRPLAWDAATVYLLGRDGRLWQFAPGEATDFRKTSSRFQSYSVSKLRAMLLRELGQAYEVSGTSHYLVAHPRGQRQRWAERLEELYRSLVRYFAVRGFRIEEPAFPLVAVVCPSRAEFVRRCQVRQTVRGASIDGMYLLESNRIVLSDAGSGAERLNEAVLIHEATHQTLFNTSIQNRFVPAPLWTAEGLALLFEAPGVHDSSRHPERSQRINRERLADFRRAVLARHRPEMLAELIASDDHFRRDPIAAYAEAWALVFYLVETQPRQFAEYLARCAARRPFTAYPADERTADFAAVFGVDWRMLEARLLRFVAQLE